MARSHANWAFKPHYADQYTLEHLPYSQIKAAIVDEMLYFNEHVWRGVSVTDAKADPAGKILTGQWILSNKGDLNEPDCRARYVACEVNIADCTVFLLRLHRLKRSECFCQNGQPRERAPTVPP